MTLQVYTLALGNFRDDTSGNNYAANTPVYILNSGGTLADIFRDQAGAQPIVQDGLSNISDAYGEFTFYVNSGQYISRVAGRDRLINVVGSDYFDSRVDDAVEQITQQTMDSRGFRVVGTFADGFTYELFNDVGIDANGNSWIYVGAGAPNKVVSAGAVPSVGDGYEQVTFNAASGVIDSRGTNVQDYIDGNLTPFKTVADMKAAAYLSALPEFTRVEWQGYYSQSDGGSNWGVLRFGSHTEDGGSIFSINENTYIEANLKGGVVNVRKFGAKLTGVFNDQPAVQSAADYVWSKNVGGLTTFGIYDATMMSMKIPSGKCHLESSVGVHAYMNIICEDTSISTSGDHFAFVNADGSGFWRFNIISATFMGCNGADMDNGNLDTGRIVYDKCKFIGCPTAVRMKCQSTYTEFKACLWYKCTTELEILAGDHVVINGGWIKQGERTANQQAGIINYGKLTIRDAVGVPTTAAGFTETAWVNNHHSPSLQAGGGRSGCLLVDNFRSGGEASSKTLVNNFAAADISYPINQTYVHVINSDVYSVDGGLTTDRGIIRLFNVPNSLRMTGCTGMLDSKSISAGNGVDLSTIVSTAPDLYSIKVDNPMMSPIGIYKNPANYIPEGLLNTLYLSNTKVVSSFGYSIASEQNGIQIVNQFSGGTNTITLPTAKVGLEYTVIRNAESVQTKIKPATGDTITGGAVNDQVTISVNKVGLKLKCYVLGFWEIERVINSSFGVGYSLSA